MAALMIGISPEKGKKQGPPPKPGAKPAGASSAPKPKGPPKPPGMGSAAPPTPDATDPAGGDEQADSGELAQCHEDVEMIYKNAPSVGAALCKFIGTLCREESGEVPPDDGMGGAPAGAPPMGADQGGGGY